MPEHLIPTSALIGAWVAVGLTLFIFSFLYKDNPLFKLGEHLYVGISVGYSVVVVWYTVFIRLVWQEIAKDNCEPLIPVVIGLLIWTRFIPKIAWLSRLAFAFVVGFGSGVAIPRTISSSPSPDSRCSRLRRRNMRSTRSWPASRHTTCARSSARRIARC